MFLKLELSGLLDQFKLSIDVLLFGVNGSLKSGQLLLLHFDLFSGLLKLFLCQLEVLSKMDELVE